MGTEKPTPKSTMQSVLDQTTESKAEDSYDYAKNTVTVFNMGARPIMLIQDPEVVQDMMVTKNLLVDKNGSFSTAVNNYFGDGLLFTQSNDKWKQKRKGIAHVFFKDKLIVMLEKLKDYALEAQ